MDNMTLPTLIGFSKDDLFSQNIFKKFFEKISSLGYTMSSSKYTPSISGIPQNNVDEQNSILIVFGGDGTMLRALKHHKSIPTIGINCGSFGFLSEFEASNLDDAITFIQKAEWIEEQVNMIESSLEDTSYLGVNECVISGADTGRPVDLRVMVDGITMYESRGDGLIINSPIGSTAYNIASGGAIISPNIHALSITPIAPFLTLDRSVIVDSNKVIEILNLERTRSCKVFYDGIFQHELLPGQQFTLKSANEYSIFLRRPGSFSRRMALKIANRYPIR